MKQKYKPNHQQKGLPPHSALHVRGGKKIAQISPYMKLTQNWTKLRRAETNQKKEFNPEAWEKETSNTVC